MDDGTVRLVVPAGLASVGMDTRGVLTGETGNVDKSDIYIYIMSYLWYVRSWIPSMSASCMRTWLVGT